MKDFLKYTFATITGLVIVTVAMGVIGVVSIVGMAAAGQATTNVEDNSVLVLPLKGIMSERATEDVFAMFGGSETESIGLQEVLTAIRKAKDNDKIKGIYIEAGLFAADSPASAQAIRKQLEEFKKAGKWIVAYADSYTQTTYYICSVANKVLINPQGMLDWHGLAAQPVFLKDMLAKFGVKMQLSKVGKYKSAPEMLTADGMSEANREQVAAYINGTWNIMLSDVAKSRKLPKETLNAYADNFYALADPKDYVKARLVDRLTYAANVKNIIKGMMKVDSDEAIKQLSVSDMMNIPEEKTDDGVVAIYYAEGDVVDSRPAGLGGDSYIAADEMCRDLEQIADDDDIKAVVLRVNTGGGSAYASEQIWFAVEQLKKKKPVVVSMGGMTASGGYYLSCAANYIFAEPTTITGSIGIFGMFPDMSGLLTEKLGVKFDEVKTNKFSAFGTPARPFSDEEMAYLNAYVDRGYKLFRQRVADGRKMSVSQVEEIAQGRVWLGTDAKNVNLIDAFGGVYDAIAKAAQLAKINKYATAAYPAPPSWIEQLIPAVSGDNYLDEQLKQTLGEYYEPMMFIKNINKHNAIQARIPYRLTIK